MVVFKSEVADNRVMYRIHREESGDPEAAQRDNQQADLQTIELLRTVTGAPDGNFDGQTHTEHVAYVEEVVFTALRNQYAKYAPSRRAQYQRKAHTQLTRIAQVVSGVTYDDMAQETGIGAEELKAQVRDSLYALTSSHQTNEQYFAQQYRARYQPSTPEASIGLLGIIKNTEPSQHCSTPAHEHPPEPSPRQRRSRVRAVDDAPLRDSMGQYLEHVGDTELLSATQEVELAKRIEAGLVAESALEQYAAELTPTETEELQWLIADGQAAKEHFTLANLRLVISIARKYKPRESMTTLDIVQEGNLGLDRAVKKFDYTKGYKFSTYATWWIKQSIQRGITKHAELIPKPVRVADEIRKLSAIETKLQQNDIEPTVAVLAQEMDCEPTHVLELLEWKQTIVSLDQPIGNGNKRFDEGTSLLNLISEEQMSPAHTSAEDLLEIRDELAYYLSSLDERSHDILVARYGLDGNVAQKLGTVGLRHGLSAERVRQIERAALKKLRQCAESEVSRTA